MTKPVQRVPKKAKGSRIQFTMQSVRLPISLNRSLKAEAKRQGMSFNLWAVEVLTHALARAEAKRERMKKVEVA